MTTEVNQQQRTCLVDFSPVVNDFAASMSQFKSVRAFIKLDWFVPKYTAGDQMGPLSRFASYTDAQDEIVAWMTKWSSMSASEVFEITRGALHAYADTGSPNWPDTVSQHLEKDFDTMWPYREKPKEGPINLEWTRRVLNGNAVRIINDAALSDELDRLKRFVLVYLRVKPELDISALLPVWIDSIPPPQMEIPIELDPRDEGLAPERLTALLRTMAIAENWNGQFGYNSDKDIRSWPLFGVDELMHLHKDDRSTSKWNWYIIMSHLKPDLARDYSGSFLEAREPTEYDKGIVHRIMQYLGALKGEHSTAAYSGEPGEELHQSQEDAAAASKSDNARAAVSKKNRVSFQKIPAMVKSAKTPLHQQQAAPDNSKLILVASAAAIAAIIVAYN